MKILIASNAVVPASTYGGTERVVWYLGKELSKLGHEVTFLVKKGSHCDFAKVLYFEDLTRFAHQIPDDIDLVHLHLLPEDIAEIKAPYVITIHGNVPPGMEMDKNTIFVSANHAQRNHSESYVYNGMDWNDYTAPLSTAPKKYFHFLGNAAWRVKNVKGAIEVIKATPHEKIKILGGTRLNIKMGFRFTSTLRASFHGMVGGEEKNSLLRDSKGLIFPVRWNEPFGLCLTESLYYGCPVFGTPYGALPEIVNSDVGFLSNKLTELAEAVQNVDAYDRKRCHEYARDTFNSYVMTQKYLEKYETVLNGHSLNAQAPFAPATAEPKFLEWVV